MLVVLRMSYIFWPCLMPSVPILPSPERYYRGIPAPLHSLALPKCASTALSWMYSKYRGDSCAGLELLYCRSSELFQPPSHIDRRATSSKPTLVGAQGGLSPEVLPQPLRNDLLFNTINTSDPRLWMLNISNWRKKNQQISAHWRIGTNLHNRMKIQHKSAFFFHTVYFELWFRKSLSLLNYMILHEKKMFLCNFR